MRMNLNGRGLPPKIKANAIRTWLFDDEKTLKTDLIGSNNFDQFAAVPVPYIASSPVGSKALRLNDSVNADVLTTTPANAPLEYQLIRGQDLTISAWVRLRSLPSVDGYIVSFSGYGVSESESENMIASLGVDKDGFFFSEWEGVAGLNERGTFSGYKVPFDKWIFVSLRVAVDVATAIDLVVNGKPLQTIVGLLNSVDGSGANSRWAIGARVQDAVSIVRSLAVDIASLEIVSGLTPIDDLKNDFRRGLFLNCYTKTDLRFNLEDQGGVVSPIDDGRGIEWLKSASISDSVDNAVKTATINLFKEQENRSLALLRTDTIENLSDPNVVTTYKPRVDAGRAYNVLCARVPLGIQAGSKDWQSIISGKVDRVSWGGQDCVLNCRDGGGVLVDTFIEEEVLNPAIDAGAPPEKQPSYGAILGRPASDCMQDILNDNDNTNANDTVAGLTARSGSYNPISLFVEGVSSFNLRPWRQKREPVLTSLRTIAQNEGRECKQKFVQGDEPSSQRFELVFYPIGRDRVDSDLLIKADEILSVSTAEIDVKQIRNVVRIPYPSSELALPAPANPDPAKYIVRSGWHGLDGAGNRMPAFVEIEDVDSVDKYGRLFFETGEASSSQIDTVTEAMAMAYAIISDLAEPNFLLTIVTTPIPEAEIGDVVDVEGIEEIATASQRMAIKSKTDTFEKSTFQMGGKASAGFKRWLRMQTTTGQGRPPIIDPRLALTDSDAGPRLRVQRQISDASSYLVGGRTLQIQNSAFEDWSAGTENMPDGWSIKDGVFGSSIFYSSLSSTGRNSIRLKADATPPSIISSLIEINGEIDVFGFDLSYSSNQAGNGRAAVRLRFYDESKLEIVYSGEGGGLHRPRFSYADDSPLGKGANNIGTLSRAAGIATVVTAVNKHDLLVGDVVSVRISDRSLAGDNTSFEDEKAIVLSTPSITSFTYASAGPDIGAHVDASPLDGSKGEILWRRREENFSSPSVADEFQDFKNRGIIPPSPTAKFMRIEIKHGGGLDNIFIDSISVYRQKRTSSLVARGATALTFSAWRYLAFRGQSFYSARNVRFNNAGEDIGRNAFSQRVGGDDVVFIAKKPMRVKIEARAFIKNSLGNYFSGRLRIVKNVSWNSSGSPANEQTVATGGSEAAGAAGLANGVIAIDVSSIVDLAVGDSVAVEIFLTDPSGGYTELAKDEGPNYFKITEVDRE